MQSATVQWVEREQFLAVGPSGHALVMDADRERNTGPGPMELLLLALGGCSGSDVVIILRKKRQALKALRIHVEGERAADPPQVWTKMKIHFTAVGKGIDPRAVEQAVELSRTRYCSVAATLSKTAAIEWSHSVEEG